MAQTLGEMPLGSVRAETDLAPPLEVCAAGLGGPWQGGWSGWRLRAHGSYGGLTAPLAVPVVRASGLALAVPGSAWTACGRGVRAGPELRQGAPRRRWEIRPLAVGSWMLVSP